MSVHGSGTAADEFCPQIRAMVDPLVSGARGEFSPTPLPGAEYCVAPSAIAGNLSYLCRWDYAYRAKGATVAFKALDQSLRDCFADEAEVEADQPVNHPDSYQLWLYQLQRAKIRLSIKDKAAEQKTHVFLWLGENPKE